VTEYEGRGDGSGRSVAIVASRFNDVVTERLLDGARGVLLERGVGEAALTVVHVPGAWELPGAAAHLAASGRYDAIVAIGCVIRGETPHFDYVAGEAARGLNRVALDHGVPVGFGLLTTDTAEQALARAGGDVGNKGAEAAEAALEMADLFRQLESR